ncbi:MAG: hypothetical protein HQL42_12450 [Alphaproteobacteria bacterium]|nr:hypothetical protein [Alphaproteobacteria bacterium]
MKDEQLTVAAQIAAMASAGMVVAVDPDDADNMGALADTALTPEAALESRFDDIVEGGE